MFASVSLRAIPRVIESFFGSPSATTVIPSPSGVRFWLQRLGLYALLEPIEVAADWAHLIDHSIQIGTIKICVILGVRLTRLSSPVGPLGFKDVRLLALIPTENSTGEIVAKQLERAAERTGIPRQIVSDHGSDVKKGSELFAASHPHTKVICDAAHFGARLLKRGFEKDVRWADLILKLGQTKARIQQTGDAFLLSPSLRPKARYMNLASVLRWGRAILALIDRDGGDGTVSARAKARYGWMEEFRAAIHEWSRWEATVRCAVSFIRTHGLSRECESKLTTALSSRPMDERDFALETELIEFARSQSEGTDPHEHLVGSTEIVESLFGKWKTLERQESNSGITSLVLSLGAMLGSWDDFRIQQALEQTPVKNVEDWCQKHLPQSVQSQRKLAFSPSEA
jgi:hypothetical protein